MDGMADKEILILNKFSIVESFYKSFENKDLLKIDSINLPFGEETKKILLKLGVPKEFSYFPRNNIGAINFEDIVSPRNLSLNDLGSDWKGNVEYLEKVFVIGAVTGDNNDQLICIDFNRGENLIFVFKNDHTTFITDYYYCNSSLANFFIFCKLFKEFLKTLETKYEFDGSKFNKETIGIPYEKIMVDEFEPFYEVMKKVDKTAFELKFDEYEFFESEWYMITFEMTS